MQNMAQRKWLLFNSLPTEIIWSHQICSRRFQLDRYFRTSWIHKIGQCSSQGVWTFWSSTTSDYWKLNNTWRHVWLPCTSLCQRKNIFSVTPFYKPDTVLFRNTRLQLRRYFESKGYARHRTRNCRSSSLPQKPHHEGGSSKPAGWQTSYSPENDINQNLCAFTKNAACWLKTIPYTLHN